jgi:hypothetical protein
MTHETQSALIGFGILILWFLAILWLTVRRYWRHLRGAPAHALAALPDTARFLHPERTGGWYGVLDVAAWTWIACIVLLLGFGVYSDITYNWTHLGPKRDSGILLAGFVIAMVMGMGIGHNLADPERFKVSEERKRELKKREEKNRKRWEEYWEDYRRRYDNDLPFTRHDP